MNETFVEIFYWVAEILLIILGFFFVLLDDLDDIFDKLFRRKNKKAS